MFEVRSPKISKPYSDPDAQPVRKMRWNEVEKKTGMLQCANKQCLAYTFVVDKKRGRCEVCFNRTTQILGTKKNPFS